MRMHCIRMRKWWREYYSDSTYWFNFRCMRMYWVYGPDQQEITIIGLEPHPEDKKKGAYDRIKLSEFYRE